MSNNGLRIDQYRDPNTFNLIKEAYEKITKRNNKTKAHKFVYLEVNFK